MPVFEVRLHLGQPLVLEEQAKGALQKGIFLRECITDITAVFFFCKGMIRLAKKNRILPFKKNQILDPLMTDFTNWLPWNILD